MSKLLLNDNELENVVGGAALDLSGFMLGKITVDMTKDKDVSVESLFNDFSSLFNDAQKAAAQSIMSTLNSNENITKCVISISSMSAKYYAGNTQVFPQ